MRFSQKIFQKKQKKREVNKERKEISRLCTGIRAEEGAGGFDFTLVPRYIVCDDRVAGERECTEERQRWVDVARPIRQKHQTLQRITLTCDEGGEGEEGGDDMSS